MSEIKIWTLNATTELLKDTQVRQSIIDTVSKQTKKSCSFGDRYPYNDEKVNDYIDEMNKEEIKIPKYHSSNLMCELDHLNEYFVPIPEKCIGRFFREEHQPNDLSVNAKTMLNDILKYSEDHKRKKWDLFWDQDQVIPNINQSAQMHTRDESGYYEILLKQKCQNILIGYSQGGLAAKYLAWLDEFVFKNNCISSVITVACPNYGSPLANEANKEYVIDLLIDILSDLIGLSKHWIIKKIIKCKIDFKQIVLLFDFLESYFKSKNAEKAFSTIQSVRKWVGGLGGDKNNAFYDLNLNRINEENSVLNCTSRQLNRIQYGSIITANNDVRETLGIINNEIKDQLVQRIIEMICMSKKLTGKMEKRMKNMFMEKKKLFASDAIKKMQRYYKKGINDNILQKYSHDFIIPSAYQIFYDSDYTYRNNDDKRGVFLGNHIIKSANHYTGKDSTLDGGKDVISQIHTLLGKLS